MIKTFVAGDVFSSTSPEAFSMHEKSNWGEKNGKRIDYSGVEVLYLVEQGKMEVFFREKEIDFDSFSALDGYFSEKDIEVLEANMIKKNMDYEFVVNLPSNVGNVKFFVKYRNKKSINEGELSLAQNSAYLKRLPLLFLSKGNLTAKGREYAGKNFIVFERI